MILAPPLLKKNEKTVTKLRAVFLNPHGIMARPLSLIVRYCGVSGGGGLQNPTKDNAPPPLSVIKIVKHCGGGGGAPKSYKNNGIPSLSHLDN